MESAVAPTQHLSRRATTASRLAFLLAGTVIHLGLLWLVASWPVVSDWPVMAGGALLYTLSQIVRAMRLTIIVGGSSRSLLHLTRAHFIGAAASFVLPFKMGELLRLSEIANVLRCSDTLGLWRAFLVIWIERVYDALLVGALLVLLGLGVGTAAMTVVASIVVALIVFVILTLLVFFVLPENLDGLALFVARRYHGGQAVRIMRLLNRLHGMISEARRLLHRKHTTLVTLSTVIWGLEMAVVWLILDGGVGGSTQALLGFLSGTLSMNGGHQIVVAAYSLVIGLPLLTLGLVSWYGQLASGRLIGSDAAARSNLLPPARRNP